MNQTTPPPSALLRLRYHCKVATLAGDLPAASELGHARAFDMLAIDVDGTILRSGGWVSPRNRKLVKEASRQGVHVVLVSARPPRSLTPVHQALDLTTLQINYNGALILDVKTNKHVYHRPLSGALAKRVIKASRKIDPQVMVSVEIVDKWYTDHFDPDQAMELLVETSSKFNPDFIGPLDAFLHVPVTKVMLLVPPQRLGRVRTAIEKRFAGKINVVTSDAHLIQVTHPEVDKSHALAWVARNYGVQRSRVMAIGDAPNDLGMLKWAGLGAAVQNGWAVVRKAADVIIGSNDEDGVAPAIEQYLLA